MGIGYRVRRKEYYISWEVELLFDAIPNAQSALYCENKCASLYFIYFKQLMKGILYR